MEGQINTPISTAESQSSQRLKVDTEWIKMRKKKQILKRKLKNI